MASMVQAAEEKAKGNQPAPPTPVPPAAEEGIGLGGEAPQEAAVDPQKEALNKLGFGQ